MNATDLMELVQVALGVLAVGGIGALRILIRKEVRECMAPLAQRVRQLELVHDDQGDGDQFDAGMGGAA